MKRSGPFVLTLMIYAFLTATDSCVRQAGNSYIGSREFVVSERFSGASKSAVQGSAVVLLCQENYSTKY